MSDAAGQAAPIARPRHLGRRLVRGGLAAGLAIVVAAACLVAGLAWRLSRGPLDVTSLVHRAVAALAPAEAARFTFGDVSIEWNGFRDGIEAPLVVRLTNVATTDASGAEIASVWRADVELSAASLLRARVVPRAIEATAARLTLTRASNGAISLDAGEQAAQAGAGGGDLTSWEQLRHLQIHGAAVTVVDHATGVTWRVPTLEADLRRRDDGGIDGEGHATLAVGEQSIDVELRSADANGAVEFHVSPFIPAQLAGVVPGLASLAALDASVTLDGRAEIGPGLKPTHATATVEIGAGIARIAQGTTRLNGATLLLDATMTKLDATLRRLEVSATPDGAKTLVQAHLLATRANGRITADITLGLDQVAFADLAALWPAGVGGPGTRPWVTANITAGLVRDAHAAVSLSSREDLSNIVLGSVNVAIDARDATVHWLKPVPPIEHIDGHLSMTTPDEIDITATTGHQTGGGVILSHERVHLSGLSAKDQFADIDADLAGPLADVVALLRHPRLKLLAKSPVPLRDVAGQVTGHLSLTHLPLEDKVALDDIQIKAHTRLTGVHLGGLIAGHDLDRGVLDLDAGNDGMGLRGTAVVAGVPARLGFDMDFRNGPPTQLLEKITAEGVVEEPALAALGIGTAGVLSGPVPVRVEAQFQRGGRGDVAVHADFSRAAVKADPIDYRKAPGGPATGDLRVVLDHDRIIQVDELHVAGPGIDIKGEADFAGGRPNVLRVTSLRLGETNLSGEVRLPAKAGEAYAVRLIGPSLDASGFLGGKSTPTRSKPNDDAPGTPFSVDARIARVKLADRAEVTGLVASVEDDGRIIRQAHIRGSVAGRAPFSLDVDPAGRGRRLDARAADAGALLRAAGVLKDVVGGRLSVTGAWDDANPRHPLGGQVELDDFRIRDAPVLGKILQAMTLYGLVDVVTTGPGLNFTRAVAPFRLAGGVLELTEARAFSASLGMTAKGSIDLDRRQANLEGTVVPAYFFNTLLGNLPLIGRVFSPEKGGGVFAATYSVKGPLDDPSIGVNPLAALTPGFLRGLFDGFDTGSRAPSRGGAGSGGNR